MKATVLASLATVLLVTCQVTAMPPRVANTANTQPNNQQLVPAQPNNQQMSAYDDLSQMDPSLADLLRHAPAAAAEIDDAHLFKNTKPDFVETNKAIGRIDRLPGVGEFTKKLAEQQLVAMGDDVYVIRGEGIRNFLITQDHYLRPGQHALKIDTSAKFFNFKITGISKDKHPYELTAKFSMTLRDCNQKLKDGQLACEVAILTEQEKLNIYNYVSQLGSMRGDYRKLEHAIEGILQEAVRELFNKKTALELLEGVSQEEEENIRAHSAKVLKAFGFKPIDVQFQTVRDPAGSYYFRNLGQAKRTEDLYAEASATAEMRKAGAVRIAQLQAQQASEMSQYEVQQELAKKKKEEELLFQQTKMTAEYNLKREEEELKNKQLQEIAKAKHDVEVYKAQTDKEIAMKEKEILLCDARRNAAQAEAQASELLKEETKLKVMKIRNEAALETAILRRKIAEEKAKAEGARLREIVSYLGTSAAAMDYLCIMEGVTVEMARYNAEALRNTRLTYYGPGPASGNGQGGLGSDVFDVMKKLNTAARYNNGLGRVMDEQEASLRVAPVMPAAAEAQQAAAYQRRALLPEFDELEQQYEQEAALENEQGFDQEGNAYAN